MSRSPTFRQLAPGGRVDHFVLDERVGLGSSGEVWRAHDSVRTAAIKFMNAHLLHGDDAERHRTRFRGEVQMLERLADVEHVPVLYGYNLHYERPYLVMAYVDAPSWAALLGSGAMMTVTLPERLRLLETAAHALTQIHKRGVIHRDIKPGNLHGVDYPYILDFSVAIDARHAARAAPNVGTGLYMPPDNDRPPGFHTDSFAFALVAYEMLFGQHAVFRQETLNESFTTVRQRMRQRLHDGTWHLPSALSPAELPGCLRGADLPALDALFGEMLAVSDRRPRDLSAFVAGLRAAVNTPENAPYLLHVPELPVAPGSVPEGEAYTMHEVRRARQPTHHPPGSLRLSRRASRRLRRGAVVVALLWVIALALVVMSVLMVSSR